VKLVVSFNEISDTKQLLSKTEGLTFVIRSDADYATAYLKNNIKEYLSKKFNQAANVSLAENLDYKIKKTVHEAYRHWGRSVLDLVSGHIDYNQYGITNTDHQYLNVNLYDAAQLSRQVRENAGLLVQNMPEGKAGVPALYISLDEMIKGSEEDPREIAFSRLFSIKGDQAFGYVARPGKKTIEEQIQNILESMMAMKAQYKTKIPFVLLEDNVRQARMLNWVIERLEKGGIFDYGDLAGISTCFCCADDAEKALIMCKGKEVPVVAVIDFDSMKVDVVTPRDLLFDGFVVEIGGRTTRLPGVFMETEKVFKIPASRVLRFHEEVRNINTEFCESLETELNVSLSLSWFKVADAISFVTGQKPESAMKNVLKPKSGFSTASLL